MKCAQIQAITRFYKKLEELNFRAKLPWVPKSKAAIMLFSLNWAGNVELNSEKFRNFELAYERFIQVEFFLVFWKRIVQFLTSVLLLRKMSTHIFIRI